MDENIKQITSRFENGELLEIDDVAHIMFFYNTLNCAHAFSTENPLKHPDQYKAFKFKTPSPDPHAK